MTMIVSYEGDVATVTLPTGVKVEITHTAIYVNNEAWHKYEVEQFNKLLDEWISWQGRSLR